MAEDKREWISALADGELAGTELGKTLDSLRGDAPMQHSWSRYHLIRDTLHSNLEPQVNAHLHERITAALEQEPVLLAPQRHKRPWLRHAAGLAVAASVSGVAVVALQQMNHDSTAKPATMAEVMQPNKLVRLEQPVVAATENTHNEDKLAPYLVNHNEYSASSGMHGMLSYVRVVGHGGGK